MFLLKLVWKVSYQLASTPGAGEKIVKTNTIFHFIWGDISSFSQNAGEIVNIFGQLVLKQNLASQRLLQNVLCLLLKHRAWPNLVMLNSGPLVSLVASLVTRQVWVQSPCPNMVMLQLIGCCRLSPGMHGPMMWLIPVLPGPMSLIIDIPCQLKRHLVKKIRD